MFRGRAGLGHLTCVLGRSVQPNVNADSGLGQADSYRASARLDTQPVASRWTPAQAGPHTALIYKSHVQASPPPKRGSCPAPASLRHAVGCRAAFSMLSVLCSASPKLRTAAQRQGRRLSSCCHSATQATCCSCTASSLPQAHEPRSPQTPEP